MRLLSIDYRIAFSIAALVSVVALPAHGPADEPAEQTFKNSQSEDIPFLAPDEALRSVQAPEGFRVSLLAHEPQVQQPIAAAFDSRGRLWGAENYTYAENKLNHDLSYNDRIIILDDQDADGKADERKVFWESAKRLTSVELGFGGVWALAPPHLLFIPDRDRDDIPDGEPEVVLDGWDADASRHNFVNGLRWGPDGWLYGRHGILAKSLVGPPGSEGAARTPLNCAIWRFHPVTRKFEVVCHGTTNPWGHDWDENGQLFFINTVIGHLWHSLPGAHFRRMYGDDLNPHVYELIEQTADHVHWDSANEDWTALRTKALSTATDAAGGGHAHSGLLIYQGDQWPLQYRGQMLTLNFHGRRINADSLEREGATFVGKHQPDLLKWGDPYFRGIDLLEGPDGGVYVLDWSDIGECHENDGVHRTSGRIYKVTHFDGASRSTSPKPFDLHKLSSRELVLHAVRGHEWFSRRARLVLQERSAAEQLNADIAGMLREEFDRDDASTRQKLRALWGLHLVGGADESWLLARLDDPNEHIRLWAVQLLVDSGQPTAEAVAALQRRADLETDGLVLVYLASAMQRLPASARFAIANSLVRHREFADDRVLPLMIWYGLESAVPQHPQQAIDVLQASQMPRVSEFIARRMTSEIENDPPAVEKLVGQIQKTNDARQREALLKGMAAALNGWLKAPQPEGWDELVSFIDRQDRAEAKRLVQELSVVFGSGRAVEELKVAALDKKLPPALRRRAIRSLADAKVGGATELLASQLGDRDVVEEAVRGLASVSGDRLAEVLLPAYSRLSQPGKAAAIEALASRPALAGALLDAVEQKTIDPAAVQPFQLRQLQLSAGDDVRERIAKLWPELRLIDGDRLKQIAALREQLTSTPASAANLANGQKIFSESCAKCHKLFGRGESVGPELTGAQRTNLNYLLENIVDPSASVATSFRMSVILLDDGRVLNGVVTQATERTLVVQTPTERLTIDRRTVEEVKPSELSLMPNGLVDQLSREQIRDLFAFLMSPGDPLAESAKGAPSSGQ